MVIATVFLVIIGASAGYALGTEHRRDDWAAETPAPAEPDNPAGPPRLDCPPEIQKTASARGHETPLEQVLRVRADDTGTTVWICADSTGGLFYQSNKGGYQAKWIEGETALFLPGVEQRDGIFVVTAPDGNVFSVDRSELRIKFASGEPDEVHPVREE